MSSFGEAAIEAATSRYEYGDERKAHVEGWKAARTYLAAQEPTDVEVGAVQKCLYERTLTWVPTVEVRAALSAARAARRDEEKR